MTDPGRGEVQPWLLAGERRRRRIESLVRAAAEQWAMDWVAGPVGVAVTVEPAATEVPLESGDRRTMRFGVRSAAGAWLAHLVVPMRLVAWAAGLGAVELAGIADSDASSPFGAVELEMARAFWDLLFPQPPGSDAALECLDDAYTEHGLTALLRRGWRTTCVFAPAPGLSLQWTLSPVTIAALLAERPSRHLGEALTSRRAALALAPVSLDGSLGSVQVLVRDLRSLRIGDVLVTDIALDAPAQLRVSGKAVPIGAGPLGESSGQKAIRFETARVVTANQGLRP